MNAAKQADLGIFQNELKGFVLKRVKDRAVAEDIVQDVFLKVYTKMGQLKDTEKLSAWIYQITRNTITDYFRKKSQTIDPESINWESDTNDLNYCVALCLRQLVKTLPDKYKEAFQLAEIDNLSQIQLADKLGISYSGAKSRVQRARLILKQKMEEMLIIKTDSYGNVIVCEDKNPCGC
jgi:RNA polymerase sigma-70 factor, ECF subfamily